MSTSYYYFAATLPSIEFDSKPPFTVEEFLQECSRLMAEGDCSQIQEILTLDPVKVTAKCPAVACWIEFASNFKNELVYTRAQKLQKDASEFMRGQRVADPLIAEASVTASKESNPLEAEKIIDRAKWSFLDQQMQGQFYNFDFILYYGLKIQILERYQKIASNRGAEVFDELIKSEILKELI